MSYILTTGLVWQFKFKVKLIASVTIATFQMLGGAYINLRQYKTFSLSQSVLLDTAVDYLLSH